MKGSFEVPRPGPQPISQAICSFCEECAGNPHFVLGCDGHNQGCLLYPFRMGHPTVPSWVVDRQCHACKGSYIDVAGCDLVDCPLHPHRPRP